MSTLLRRERLSARGAWDWRLDSLVFMRLNCHNGPWTLAMLCFSVQLFAQLWNPEALGAASSWAQFRGPNGLGVAASDFPTHFGPASNVLWRTELPSGHSSPCISGERVFITGYSNNLLITYRLDRPSGTVRWSKTLPAGPIERGAHLGNPATATPVTDGDSVFVYFGAFGLAAYSADGEERWRKPLPIPVMQHGAGASPVLAGNRLIMSIDQDTESYLLALDKANGKVIWEKKREGFRRGFATPLPWPPEKPESILLPGTLRLVAYGITDGAEQWSVRGFPNEAVSSPIVAGNLVIAGGWTHGSGVARMPSWEPLLAQGDLDGDKELSRQETPPGPAQRHFVYIDADKNGRLTQTEYLTIARVFDEAKNVIKAIRLGGSGDVTDSHVVWTQSRGVPYCPTPLGYRGMVYLLKNGGLLTCLDAATGMPHYQEERLGVLGDNYASPIAGGDKVLIISQPGTAVVIRAGPTLEVLARNPLGEPVMATPAIVDGILYVRTATKLYAFRLGKAVDVGVPSDTRLRYP